MSACNGNVTGARVGIDIVTGIFDARAGVGSSPMLSPLLVWIPWIKYHKRFAIQVEIGYATVAVL